MRNQFVRLSAAIFISGFFLWLAFRQAPPTDVFFSILAVDWEWVALATLLQYINMWVRARLWVAVLAIPTPTSECLWANGVGYLFNNVFPFRLGDAVRTVVLRGRTSIPTMRIIGSLSIERVLDVTIVSTTMAICLFFITLQQSVLDKGGQMAMLAGAVFLVLALLLIIGRRVLVYLGFERLAQLWNEFVRAWVVISNGRIFLKVASWSILTWLLSMLMYWCVMRAFVAEASFIEAAVLTFVLVLAQAVPSAPGFIGVFQFAGQQGLAIPFAAKYDITIALGIATLAHLVYYVSTTSVGLLSFWKVRRTASDQKLYAELKSKIRAAIAPAK